MIRDDINDYGVEFLTPLDPSLRSVMGQRMELSFYDAKIINLVYCSGRY